MSSTQQHSIDLIEFNDKSDNGDVLDKPHSDIVQKMVMSETKSASLIATAVAKLTTSTVTSTINNSESESATDSPSFKQQSDTTYETLATDNNASTTVSVKAPAAAPRKTIILINSTQVCNMHQYFNIKKFKKKR